MLRGTDISHLDTVNLATIPNDISFVAIKASQGATSQDPNFQNNYHTLKNDRPEIVRIAGLFFDWKADGPAQANNFLSRGVNFTEPGTGPMMLDLEADSGSSNESYVINNRAACIQNVNDFTSTLRQSPLYGRRDLIIYSNDDFIENVIRHEWPDCIFWVSSFQENAPPFLPGWEYKFWQYSEFGQLNGDTTGGNFDLDYFMGTQADLDKLANK